MSERGYATKMRVQRIYVELRAEDKSNFVILQLCKLQN